MRYLLLFFLAALTYRIIFCASGFVRINYYQKKYESYLAGKGELFSFYEAPTMKLFKQAKISEPMVPFCKPIGYGKIFTSTVSVFDNMTNKRQDIVCNMTNCFLEAKGYFRMSLLECFSPLYWIQLLCFLPSKLCEYLGISGDKLLPKVIQLLYWVLAPALLIFRTQLYGFITQLLQNA